MKRWILLICFLMGLGAAIAFHWPSSLLHTLGISPRGTYQSIILDFREDAGDGAILTQLEAAAKQFNLNPRLNSEFSEADHIYIVQGGKKLLKQLRKSELANYTEAIEPNYLYSIPEASQVRLPLPAEKPEKGRIPNDPLYPRQWNLQRINVEAAWQINKGKGTIVAVIDTGISRVSDFAQTDFLSGYDFINDNTDATDDHGHGTHLAGTIAQSTNNGYGAAGIAPEATLLPIKVLSVGGSGTVADIAEAVRFAADKSASVINLSMVGDGDSRLLQKAIDYAHRKGAVIIAAAGNNSQDYVSFPARYRHVIGVSALDAAMNHAPYSNYGAGVDLAAPGGFIRGEDPSGGIIQNTFDRRMQVSIFAPYQGTSLAAAHVSGVAALLHTAGVIDPDRLTTLLSRSAQPLPSDPKNYYGAGKLDAVAALKLAQSNVVPEANVFDRWRDQGRIPAQFWLDEKTIAIPPKLTMLGLAIGLTLWLGHWRSRSFHWGLLPGLFFGSCGLFLLRNVYVFDWAQLPLRILGSSVSEWGTLLQDALVLNPLTASCLVPAIVTLISTRFRPDPIPASAIVSPPESIPGQPSNAGSGWRNLGIGISLGMTAALLVNAVVAPDLMGLSDRLLAQGYLVVNALLCYNLARFLQLPWDQFVQELDPRVSLQRRWQRVRELWAPIQGFFRFRRSSDRPSSDRRRQLLPKSNRETSARAKATRDKNARDKNARDKNAREKALAKPKPPRKN
ncbi:S8 family serine peptidase [Alkalinema sp. FACHB-956]|uniref:S8 family serine peptidase n=1 Tax=Alkalinema sp. FACHB-956 TaxID=2692768 RepID=UPI001688625D|nr:S8 family serine peptidase [Alkalinema sp. FACHB-956]MBD2328562.1 peptidase S8 [Alkalinema sp. FACHB-956]